MQYNQRPVWWFSLC